MKMKNLAENFGKNETLAKDIVGMFRIYQNLADSLSMHIRLNSAYDDIGIASSMVREALNDLKNFCVKRINLKNRELVFKYIRRFLDKDEILVLNSLLN
jgi:hypothetical protein